MTTPTAHSPAELADHFTRLFNAGDIDTLVQLYETEALFVPEKDQEARGHSQISAALHALREAGATIQLRLARILVVGDIAVYSNIATVAGVSPDGSDVVAPTIEVARRQSDGAWKYLIDDPGFVSLLA